MKRWQDFQTARNRVDADGNADPDCETMRSLLDEATGLLGVDDGRVTSGETIYSNVCGI